MPDVESIVRYARVRAAECLRNDDAMMLSATRSLSSNALIRMPVPCAALIMLWQANEPGSTTFTKRIFESGVLPMVSQIAMGLLAVLALIELLVLTFRPQCTLSKSVRAAPHFGIAGAWLILAYFSGFIPEVTTATQVGYWALGAWGILVTARSVMPDQKFVGALNAR